MALPAAGTCPACRARSEAGARTAGACGGGDTRRRFTDEDGAAPPRFIHSSSITPTSVPSPRRRHEILPGLRRHRLIPYGNEPERLRVNQPERRGRDLVNSSTCSLRSTRATRWLMYCEPLSAWNPLASKGNASISASSTGTGKRSESASTAATNSYCVTSSTRLTSYTPFLPSRSPGWTESTRTKPGRPGGCGLRRSPILTWVGFVFVMGLRRRRSLGQWRRRYKWLFDSLARRSNRSSPNTSY